MTDDYDFRASERRRARELDELEARRLRARERQRAQLRAAHRRRRLGVLGVLGIVIGVASGAWVWKSDTPKARVPTVPVKVAVPAKPLARTMPAITRGVHVTAAWASIPGNLDSVIATPGLNLIEIDVKDENGEVAGLGESTPALARRYGAERDYYDLKHVVALAHDRHIWVVARLVSFKDPIVAARDKPLAIHDASGAIWHDGGGVPWLNQYSPKAWAYLISLGKASARAGVDEVQFDYVRFPSEGDLSSMRWPHKKAEPKNATIPRFLAAAHSALEPLHVKVGVDLFGLAAAHELGIGQDVALIGKHVDVISPMLYPNHFGPGELGVSDPNGSPNTIVALSMGTFRGQLINSPNVKIRPWLQDFGGYGMSQVKAQISAAMGQGAVGWMLWSPTVQYNWGAFAKHAG
ncbi:MAG TPA: putative glycoside hydrolase [Gaiellales bacterium]|nr:putative glycoside hydrolase [Gaiellales bacterium]